MAEFLLIHGSGHGAWCWRDMLPLLNRSTHRARAIDLPAHGADETPVSEVALDDYIDAILDAIDQPVILVGHSLAGMFISATAERAPQKIARLVYLCAWVPQDGQSALDVRASAPRQLLLDAMVRAPDGLSTSFDPAKVQAKFYQDCPPGTLEFALQNLCWEPTAPSNTPVHLGPNYAGVPRSYIRCLQDQAIPPEFQVTLSNDWPASDIFQMSCGHSPFFARPDQLAELLIGIAAK